MNTATNTNRIRILRIIYVYYDGLRTMMRVRIHAHTCNKSWYYTNMAVERRLTHNDARTNPRTYGF